MKVVLAEGYILFSWSSGACSVHQLLCVSMRVKGLGQQ